MSNKNTYAPPVAVGDNHNQATHIDDDGFGHHDPEPESVAGPMEEVAPMVEEVEETAITIENFLTGPAPKHDNVTLDHEVYVKLPENVVVVGPLRIVPKRMSRTESVSHWGLTKEDVNDQRVAQYVQQYIHAVRNSVISGSYYDKEGFFEKRLDEEDTEWVQEVMSEGTHIGVRTSNIKDRYEGDVKLRGKKARSRINALLGTGVEVRASLIHTGLDAMFAPSDEIEFLKLDQQVNRSKVKAGYDTAGVIYQNSQFGETEHIFDFAMKALVSINLKEWEDDDIDLGDVIRITDLLIIKHAISTANNPNGYPLEIPCSAGTANCMHVESVNLNVAKTLWINKTALTKGQLTQLRLFRQMRSIKEVNAYQEMGNSKLVEDFKVNFKGRDFEFYLKVPTVNEYLDAGRAWVADVEASLLEVITTQELTEFEKKTLIENAQKLQVLREYSSWIKKIVINGNEVIDDRVDVEVALEALSANIGDNAPIEQTFENIQKFIEGSSNAIVALPNYSCPVCGRDHQDPETLRHPELVPLDPTKYFLALKDRQILRLGLKAKN